MRLKQIQWLQQVAKNITMNLKSVIDQQEQAKKVRAIKAPIPQQQQQRQTPKVRQTSNSVETGRMYTLPTRFQQTQPAQIQGDGKPSFSAEEDKWLVEWVKNM